MIPSLGGTEYVLGTIWNVERTGGSISVIISAGDATTTVDEVWCRPGWVPREGMVVLLQRQGDGTLWALGPAQESRAHTPALTAATTDPVLGTGGFARAYWTQFGSLIVTWGQIRFGTSGTSAGSGAYRIRLPVNVDTDVNHWSGFTARGHAIGTCNLYDGTNQLFGWVRRGGATGGIDFLNFFVLNPAASGYTTAIVQVTHAVPWAWGANMELAWSVTYPGVP